MIHRLLWTGWGLLIGVIGFGCLMLAQFGVDAVMNDDRYYEMHAWPKLLGMWMAAAISWPVGRALNVSNGSRVVTTDAGGAKVTRLANEHTLLFIPAQYWWGVYLALGLVLALA